jgi:hypothetical protein
MAVKEIAYKPDLTKEQAEEIFRQHFAGKYKVEDFKGWFRDFVVTKNPYVGVAVKLEQDDEEKTTKFVYSGIAPAMWARVLLGNVLGILLWNSLTNEVEAFIESAPEFK